MIAMVFIMLPLSACRTDSTPEWRVALESIQVQRAAGEIEVRAGIELQPSPAMLEALERGVTLTLLVALRAPSGPVWLPGLDERRRHRLELSYLPLSRHYELVDLHNDRRSTYPRLSMLLDALRRPRSWSIPVDRGDDPARVHARIQLDRTRLPSPMRLPTWFNRQWRLSSPWYELPLADPAVLDSADAR